MTLAGNAIELYAQFNPYTGSGREFAHAYAACGYPPACGNPADWQYNTYTKFRFWVKIPTNAGAPDYSGQGNCQVGLYNKSITNADTTVDEGGGGGHFYHAFSVEPTGTWWQVILNMHPSHERGINHVDPGFIPYITADPSRGGQDPTNTYNYWDVLTRFYLQCNTPAGSVWNLDQMEFYRDPVTEDDIHLASTLTGTYVPGSNQVIVNWERQIPADSTNWEVRYAYSDIHSLGWNNAIAAPNGTVTPPGNGDYVEMHYASTAIPTAGQTVLYVAVKSQTEPAKFNQIAIPLSGGAPPPPPPPPSTPTVSISASPSSITSGQSTTLSWSSSNVTSCTASGGWSGTRATSGNLSVSPTTTTTYTLTCNGANGSANQSAIVTVSSLPPPPPAPPPSSGSSAAAYSLDEGSGSVAADSSGNGNTLSLSGPSWSSGKTGNALLFNGTGFADAADSNSLNITSNELTLEAWVNPTTLSGDTHIVSKIVQAGQHNSPFFAYSLHVVSGNVPRFWVTMGGAGHTVQSSVGLTVNAWYHIAGTYDGSTMNIYVNGQLVGSASASGNINGYTGPLRLAANGSGGEVWNGKIDDVRVYSRALSQAEIQADMNTPIGGGGGVVNQPPAAPSALAVQ